MASKDTPLEITEQSNSVEFELNKEKYKLTISNNSKKINLKIEDLLSLQKDEYTLQTSLKALQDLNRFFSFFSNLQEVNQSLIKQVKRGNINISKGGDKCKFTIRNPINDEEFDLELPKVEGENKEDTKQDVQGSIPLLTELKKKVEALESKIESLEEKFENVKNIEQKVEILKSTKTKRAQEDEDEEEETDDGKILFKSNILDKKNERAIKKFIQGKLLSTELVFDTAADGDTIDAFKNKVEGLSPTLLVVKTDTGAIFGGYATTPWKKNGPLSDYNSFVFSLNPNKKYAVNTPKYAIFGYDQREKILFQFGCVCFRILANCTQTNQNIIRGSNYDKGFIDFIQGDHKFRVSRLEVFKLNF